MPADLDAVHAALADIGVDVDRAGPAAWRVEVPCTDRGSITVGVAVAERTLRMQAFVMRAPDRRHEDVYRRLLQKNVDLRATGPWRFGVDEHGDVFVAADMRLGAEAIADLDGVLGALAALVDATWAGLVRTGFAFPEGDGAGRAPARPPGGRAS